MVYFTSDLHIGQAKIIQYCKRPFATVEAMNETLIGNWNRRVTGNDTVYVIGDLFFRDSVRAEDYLGRMNGEKRLVIGNNDKEWMWETDLHKYFASVERISEITEGSRNFVLCHYPMMSWNGMDAGSYHIYGHIHNNLYDSYWPLLRTMDNALNAGVDINGFIPVTFEELAINNIRHKEASSQMQPPDKK